MNSLESWLLSFLVNSAWQVPLLFAIGWVAAHSLGKAGPAAVHRCWVGTLLLEALLPACSALPLPVLRSLFLFGGHGNDASAAQVRVVLGVIYSFDKQK